MTTLSHFDAEGAGRMVDVGAKPVTLRRARAAGYVTMQPETLTLINDRKLEKGDVYQVARLAGIMATKRTAELIPLCHSLGLDSAEVRFRAVDEKTIRIEADVSVHARTGVEMEALTAVTVALSRSAPAMFPMVRLGLVFGVLLLPCVCMGASLPVLSEFLVRDTASSFASMVGLLYGSYLP